MSGDGLKVCKACTDTIPLSGFYKHPSTRDKLSPSCKGCEKLLHRIYLRDPMNFARHRNSQYFATIRKLYAMTAEEWLYRVECCGGCCQICGYAFTNGVPHIDHCHQTGAVRGLLCKSCNTGIGLLKDSPRVAENAAAYLKTRHYEY